jgi:predicted transcriptional regulator
MARNARSATVKKYLAPEHGNFRLTQADREFLADLAKVRIVDEKDAGAHHYQGRKTPASRRLDKLCEVGILEKTQVNQPGRGNFKAYQFKTDKMASLFGGKRPVIGRKRNALHEVICSKIYFAEGRPDTWMVEGDFKKEHHELFQVGNKTLTGRDSCIPDAMFVRDGRVVAVEADSGQYNQTQIMSKHAAWNGFDQVWGQPAKASARVHNATVHRF